MKSLPMIVSFGLFASFASCAQTAIPAAQSDMAFSVGSDGRSLVVIELNNAAGTRRCPVDGSVSQARISFDSAAVIVSENAYVLMSDFARCHVAAARLLRTPPRAGMLADVNVRHGLYISLSPVSTGPMSFVATVAKLGSQRNLVSLPGSYVPGESVQLQLRRAFSYDDANGPYAKISLNGRYVSVSGVVDCAPDAYPGVWISRLGKRW